MHILSSYTHKYTNITTDADCLLLKEHIAGIIRTLCAGRQSNGVKTVIIKIETQINHLHTQLYSNDPLRQKSSIKEAFDLCLSLYTPIPLYKRKQNHSRQNRLYFPFVYFNNITF